VIEAGPGAEAAPSGAPLARVGGIVVRFDAQAAEAAGLPGLAWIPAALARRVGAASATITLGSTAGISLGLALVEGRLTTLVGLGTVAARPSVVVVSRPDGEPWALAVSELVQSGRLDVADGEEHAILLEGAKVARLDVDAMTTRLEAAFWIADPAPERLSLIPRSRRPQP
jgi:hypothetical protein